MIFRLYQDFGKLSRNINPTSVVRGCRTAQQSSQKTMASFSCQTTQHPGKGMSPCNSITEQPNRDTHTPRPRFVCWLEHCALLFQPLNNVLIHRNPGIHTHTHAQNPTQPWGECLSSRRFYLHPHAHPPLLALQSLPSRSPPYVQQFVPSIFHRCGSS